MKPVIFALSGERLTPDERTFFAQVVPAGFILFGRNCTDPDQLRALTDELRSIAGREELAILIDQEAAVSLASARPAGRNSPALPYSTGFIDVRRSAASRRCVSMACASHRSCAKPA
jgi:beta-N-acetylhexosaminidase